MIFNYLYEIRLKDLSTGINQVRGSKGDDGVENYISPDNTRSMFIFENNKCNLGCCPSVYSCDKGCVCSTEEQDNYISKRGNNHTVAS